MATLPAGQGLRITVGIVCANQRLQCVVPYLKDGVLIIDQTAVQVITYWETNVIPAWRDVLAQDCYIDGVLIEPMCKGKMIPLRRIYSPSTYQGTVSGESYSPNASMLMAWYSADEATTPGKKTHVGKTFFGPPPEGKCAADSVDLAFVASECQTLATQLKVLAIGGGGPNYYRSVGVNNAPGVDLFTADTVRVRSTVFTQRRRVKPVL